VLRETVFRPQPIRSRAGVRLASFAWASAADSLGVQRGGTGIELATWSARFETQGPWPHSSRFLDTTSVETATRVATLWVDRLWHPTRALTARTGARLELGRALRNAPAARTAPRVSVRYAVGASSLSVAGGQTYQYAQALAPTGPGRNAVATTDALWAVAGPEVPVLATRVGTIGAERWITPSWLASATAYRRDAMGVLLPDPRPGYVVDRPLAVEGRGRAEGIETSLRTFGARLTGGVSFTSSRATLEAYGLRFASPFGRPRVFRADAVVRVGPVIDGVSRLRLGLAWERADGTAFTRYYDGVAVCDAARHCRWQPAPRVGSPAAERGGPTRRLDASINGAWAAERVLVNAFLQVRNVTSFVNDAAYLVTLGRCAADDERAGTCHPALNPQQFEDSRLTPLRGWLSAGVRLSTRAVP
jgi:hypothetical protein